jgi:N-acetylneuraminate synthase
MSTDREIDTAVEAARDAEWLTILHCHSAYPAPADELNLRTIQWLRDRYGLPVGYSAHETESASVLAAVALGAVVIERHITLDRTAWGSDHRASLEPVEFAGMVNDVRRLVRSLGEPCKRVWPSEEVARERLRGRVA